MNLSNPPSAWRDPSATRPNPAFLHASLLALVLCAFRVEKVMVMRLDFGPAQWALTFLPDLGVALMAGTTWSLIGRFAARGRRWVPDLVGFLLFTLLYVSALIEHQFFLHTGTGLRFGVAMYALGELEGVADLVASGIDSALLLRGALVVLALILAIRLGNRQATRRPLPKRWLTTVGVAALGMIVASERPGIQVIPLGITSFIVPANVALPNSRSLLDLYRPPRVEAAQSRRAPNILLIVLESTRADAVTRRLPDGELAMPFLSRASESSLRASDMHAVVPHTSKALVALLCGMYPRMRMRVHEAVPGQLPLECAPNLLERAGYRTAFMQTAAGTFESRTKLLSNIGFDEWRVKEDLEHEAFAKTGYLGTDEFAMLEPAMKWMQSTPDAPFFLTLLTLSTHHPYETPGRPFTRGDDERNYAFALKHVDRFLSALWARLKASGLHDDTWVIVTGDHGEAFAEHDRRQHDVVPYDEVLRVPFMILNRPPRSPGGEMDGLRSQLDVLPTLLDIAGVEWSGQLPGRSLFAAKGHDRIVSACHYDNYCMALVSEERRYVYHFDRLPLEAYDRRDDPLERRNIASTLSADDTRAIVDELLLLRASVDAFYREFP